MHFSSPLSFFLKKVAAIHNIPVFNFWGCNWLAGKRAVVYEKLAVAFEAGKNLFLKYSLENFYNELPIQLEFF